MELPLVSIVCLCYNHERFVEEALESVLHQTYPNIEIIVVDDGSSDSSLAVITKVVNQHDRRIELLALPDNQGNCTAFNRGLKLVTGDFVIDFSTDDVMLPDRIELQVDFFLKQSQPVGVVFTDAVYINEMGVPLRKHYDYLRQKKRIDHVPTGDVFRDVLTRYFIAGPTMMVHKDVMDALHGYDENLAYEDFDFWVRASRDFQFAFLNVVTTKVRLLPGSLSTNQYQKGDRQLHSTFLVCLKAEKLCHDEGDREALRWRVRYEYKHAAFSENKTELKLFSALLKRLGKIPLSFFMIHYATRLPLPWAKMRKAYHQLRYG